MLPSQFSHYRLVSSLGQGGMGELYLAEDVSLGRKVALKFLLESAGGEDTSKRLLREARAAAHLDHPFICKVYETGEHEGRPFIAMEYVEGVTLARKVGAVSVPEVLRLAGEIAEAIHFAHGRGIVHRDLKPSNVMVAADGHVKVMDFGIAKRIPMPVAPDATTAGASSVTVAGHVTGTVAYMSPEQLRGDPIDPRSDVFAFGVVLHELLTGTNPFHRATTIETAHAILVEPAPPLPESLPDAPPLLAHVVNRCLEKDRERRYQSLNDVRIELESLLAAPGVPAAASRWRRGALALGLVAALAIGGAAALGWLPASVFRLTSEPALAFRARDWIVIADFNNLTGDAVFDRSLRLALEVAVAQSQYVNVYPAERVATALRRMQRDATGRLDERSAAEVAVRENIRGVLACDIAQIGSAYSVTARLLDPRTGAAVWTDSAKAPGKDGVLGALDQLARGIRTSLGESLDRISQGHPLPAVTTSSLDALKMYAESLRTGGNEDRSTSDELLRQAIVLDPDFALAHAELGRRYYQSSHRHWREVADQHFTKALALRDRLSLRERLWVQAVAEDSRGNRAQAVEAYRTYLAQYPDDASGWFRLAWTQMATLRQFDEAIEGFKRAIKLDPEDASGWVNLATAYAGKHDFTSAVPAYQKAFGLMPSLQTGIFINHEYGFTLVHLGRLDEAAEVFGRMKKETQPSSRARGFRSQALLEMYRGRYGAAIGELRQAIVLNQTTSGTVSEFRDRMFLVNALNEKGQSRAADAELAAVDRLVNRLSLTPSWLVRPFKFRARQGRRAGAERILKLMMKTAGSATADASVAYNSAADRAWVDLARAELELLGGRTQRAIELLEPAHVVLDLSDSLESLAAAYALAGRLDEAVRRYEELLKEPELGNEGQETWFQSHIALARLYERLKRPDDAQRLYEALVERWKQGDEDLVFLKIARQKLAS